MPRGWGAWFAGALILAVAIGGRGAAWAEYLIGPGDVLQIVVWKHQELSRTVPVRPDGKISVPLLDDVQAAGLTAVGLKEVVAAGLQKYLETPIVTVIVAEVNAYRVTVLGEVKNPGTYALKGRMTIVDVISLAGGFTEFASTRDILVVRRPTAGQQQRVRFNYNRFVSGEDVRHNVVLGAGDTLIIR
jgi:polysaccharide export outer membrane protein